MDYLPGQYGMHYERIGLNDYHYDSLGLTGHRPYYAFAGNQLATGEQGSNGNYYWMQQQHSGQHLVGQKQYELTNHLGNVQVTVSDLPYKHGNDTMTHISPALKAVYDYYPFGSPMPGRTIMDTARKCVDMTRLDRVWKAWEMTMTEIYALSLINYHLDGEGEVFIDDNGAVEVETADEHAVFYMDLQDSLNNGGEMVLHVDWLEELGEKGFQLYVQGLDAAGEMRVFYQKHYEKPEDAVYLNIADSFTNISVGIQGNVHFRIDNIRYTGGSWVNEEVLVRVCDEGGDRYRFGFNGMLKDNEWAGMGTHLDFGARIYDSRSGRWLSVDPLAEKYPFASSYNFALNTPIQAKDPDGKVVILINGQHMGDGGKSDYWRVFKNVSLGLRSEKDVLGRWHTSEVKAKREVYAFDKAVMDRIGDHKAIYIDGSIGGFKNTLLSGYNLDVNYRQACGVVQGMEDAKDIIAGLQRDANGNITESIKIVSHSMGAAYSKGYAYSIISYAKKNNIKGVNIEFEVDFASFQPNKLKAVDGIRTIQVSHKYDKVVNNVIKIGGSEEAKQDGVENRDYYLNTNDKSKGHSIFSFSDEINKTVPQSTNNPK